MPPPPSQTDASREAIHYAAQAPQKISKIPAGFAADPADRLRAEGIGPERVTLMDSGVEPTNPFPPDLEWIMVRPQAPTSEKAAVAVP